MPSIASCFYGRPYKKNKDFLAQLERPTALLLSIPKTYSSIFNIILLLFHKQPIA